MLTKFLTASVCLLALHSGLLCPANATDSPIIIASLPRSAILAPTTNAPAYAAGVAWIGSPFDFSGTNSTDLHILTEFLFGGDYSVSITDNASNSYVLGTMTVPTFTNQNFILSTTSISTLNNLLSAIPVGQGTFPLPDGLNPTNVIGIAIADSNAVVDLIGTFIGPIHLPPREFHEVVLLTATNDAPVNAAGRAALETGDGDDGTNPVLTVEAEGLPAGSYTVNATDNTGSNTFVLGTLDEVTWTNFAGYAESLFLISGRSNTVGRAEFSLPEGLDPSNVVTISVIDSAAVVELTGNFANPTNFHRCAFNTLTPVVPGPVCTNLHGNALLQINTLRGRAHNKFSLVAQGAPASTTLTLRVNGVNVGTTKSTKQGKITLRHLPRGVDLSTVMTLEADDSAGDTVFSVSF